MTGYDLLQWGLIGWFCIGLIVYAPVYFSVLRYAVTKNLMTVPVYMLPAIVNLRQKTKRLAGIVSTPVAYFLLFLAYTLMLIFEAFAWPKEFFTK